MEWAIISLVTSILLLITEALPFLENISANGILHGVICTCSVTSRDNTANSDSSEGQRDEDKRAEGQDA